jgi:hypothetical protein
LLRIPVTDPFGALFQRDAAWLDGYKGQRNSSPHLSRIILGHEAWFAHRSSSCAGQAGSNRDCRSGSTISTGRYVLLAPCWILPDSVPNAHFRDTFTCVCDSVIETGAWIGTRGRAKTLSGCKYGDEMHVRFHYSSMCHRYHKPGAQPFVRPLQRRLWSTSVSEGTPGLCKYLERFALNYCSLA